MKIHLLSGFLGSGKTTAIQQAVHKLLQRRVNTGVITNDQGIKLVDGNFINSLNIPHRQVVNGCFCCNYDSLSSSIQSLKATNNTEIIFAESVGSCTDIVATVVKPLLKSQPDAVITLSTFADVRLLQMMLNMEQCTFDETVYYIYLKQLEEAGIIVVNKTDLVSKKVLQKIKERMNEKYGNKILLYHHSSDDESLQQWLNILSNYNEASSLKSLQIDYDIYAAGEAMLAWFDEDLEIYSANNNVFEQVQNLVNTIYKKITENKYSIGHLKFLVNGTGKISFTSNAQPAISIKKDRAAKAALLINIRVQAAPGKITELIAEAISETEKQSGCKIIVNSISAFQPGYPKPTHRI